MQHIISTQTKKKLIHRKWKGMKKSYWKWFKLLFQINFYFDEICRMKQLWPKNDQKP